MPAVILIRECPGCFNSRGQRHNADCDFDFARHASAPDDGVFCTDCLIRGVACDRCAFVADVDDPLADDFVPVGYLS